MEEKLNSAIRALTGEGEVHNGAGILTGEGEVQNGAGDTHG